MNGKLSILKIASIFWMFLMMSHLTLAAAERDFYYKYEHQTVRYKVLDEESKTCITYPGNYFAYTLESNHKIWGDLVIPEIVSDGYNDYTVVAIGDGSFYKNSITKLVLPKSVKQIGNNAFDCCWKLTTVVLHESLEYIGRYAFAGCNALTYINLPFSLTSFDEGAFTSCSSLTQIIIPNNVEVIAPYAFMNCNKLEQIIIPNSVWAIDKCAFQGCGRLESVYLPKSVRAIGEDAFKNCNKLTSVYYEGDRTPVNTGAFSGCNIKLKKIQINSNFILEPSNMILKVGESQNIIVSAPHESGYTYLLDHSFILSAQKAETDIVKYTFEDSETIVVSGVSPGYSVVEYAFYDADLKLKSLGYCYVTVIDSPQDSKIETIKFESPSDQDEQYYDLSGRPIKFNVFTKGIVIRKRAEKAEKIYIR